MLGLDCDHNCTLANDLPRRRSYAFVAYTTHSHKRVTDSNPDAEERFRIAFPLAAPIPAIESEIATLLATDTNRNDQLFKSSAALGELIAGERLDEDRVFQALEDAATPRMIIGCCSSAGSCRYSSRAM